MPLQSLHLQELQLLKNKGRASQMARPYLSTRGLARGLPAAASCA